LGVLPLFGSPKQPQFEPDGNPPIEYTVKMREFSPNNLIAHWIRRVSPEKCASSFAEFGTYLAEFHQKAPVLPPNSPYGQLPDLAQAMMDNFSVIAQNSQNPEIRAAIRSLEIETKNRLEDLRPLLQRRKDQGWIRQLHGDLQVANLVYFDKRILAFDRIEFNPDFQWIDTLSDLGFLLMDLEHQGQIKAAYACLNAYLDKTADYEGLALLRFYKIYRALVRAKIALLSPHPNQTTREQAVQAYLNDALNLQKAPSPRRPVLIITHGYSGSGKSHLARILGQHFPALVLRTDVYRQVQVLPSQDSPYSPENRAQVYLQLRDFARTLLQEGYPVLIDGTFLKAEQRHCFRNLAQSLGCPYRMIDFKITEKTLKKRLTSPTQTRNPRFGSEANLTILQSQMSEAEALSPEEQTEAIIYQTRTGWARVLVELRRLR